MGRGHMASLPALQGVIMEWRNIAKKKKKEYCKVGLLDTLDKWKSKISENVSILSRVTSQ